MRDKFVETLKTIAIDNPQIELLTGDLGFGVLKPFWEACPNQFTNVGIAEQNMTSIASGMALSGKTVFTYSIGNFPTLRCLEQIRNDCAYHNANVKIVCVGGGFSYGPLGVSHHATEDISIIKAIPNVSVFAPGDLVETEEIIKKVAFLPGTSYIRLGRGGEKRIHSNISNFEIGKAIEVKQGKDVAIFSTGAIFEEVIHAWEILTKEGFSPCVYTFPTIKPLDKETIVSIAKNYSLIVTVEENVVLGGFGSSVSDVVAELKGEKANVLKIGLPDVFTSIVGSQKFLRKYCEIDGESIARKVIHYIYEK